MLTQKSSPLIDKMAPGHLANRGHELVAHLESETGEIWHVVRECCTGNVADRHVEDMPLENVIESLAEMPLGALGSPMHAALIKRRDKLTEAALDRLIRSAQSAKYWEDHGTHGDARLTIARSALKEDRAAILKLLQNRL